MAKTTSAFVAYVPVWHRGYQAFFDRYLDVRVLYVCGESIIALEPYLRKDLRALTAGDQVKLLRSLGRFDAVEVLELADTAALPKKYSRLILPDEDISRRLAARWKPSQYELSPVFLRWDRQSVEVQTSGADEVVSADEFEQSVMREALAAARHSSDIWRRLGAVIIPKKGARIVSANIGEPSGHAPWMEGDPRNVYGQGVAIEMSVFSHAEAAAIAEAARQGVALQGATMFTSTFPCPVCAKLIARSGIVACYYTEGYAMLDGRRIMEDYGVKIVRVRMDSSPSGPKVGTVPYPPKD